MAKREAILIILLTSLLLSPFASAEVWFVTQPKTVYNTGDILNLRVGVSTPGEQLKAELNCQNKTEMIFLQHMINRGEVEILQPLTPDFLKEMKGDCEVAVTYGKREATSQRFLISNNIFLTLETKDRYFEPGKDMQVKGKAIKANGEPLNGFYEIEFSETDFKKTGEVQDGFFQVNLSLQENIKSGEYVMSAAVYEKKGEEIYNQGESKVTVTVKQVPASVELALDNQNIIPGNNLSFRILLFDQAEEEMKGDASYTIEDPSGIPIAKKISETGKTEYFFPEKNISSGYYKIIAYSSGLSSERQFYVEENQEASFRIINGTLVIKNIGNVLYNKPIEVKIGGDVEIINYDCQIGEEKRYELQAPKGTYEIKVTDGREILETNDFAIATGSAVGLREVRDDFFERSKTFAWIFLILVLGLFIFVTYKSNLKEKFVLKDRFFARKSREKKPEKAESKGGVIKADSRIKKDVRTAEHSLVLQGKKYETPVICIKIKNHLGEAAKTNLDSILNSAYEKKASIYRTGDYIMPVFSPLTTSTFKNHLPAVKTALEINKKLQEHNRKFKDKIEYGISVHSGELVSQLKEGRLNFTGVGNTISFAKRIADVSEKELLLSKEIHEKTVSVVKTSPVKKGELQLFSVNSVVNREENQAYIHDFLKRIEGKN